jgi:hypothetical protein
LGIEELRVFCCAPTVIWGGHVARIRETINAYTFLLRNPEGKGHIGRPSSKWEGSVAVDLERTGWEMQTGIVWLGTGILESSYEVSGSGELCSTNYEHAIVRQGNARGVQCKY